MLQNKIDPSNQNKNDPSYQDTWESKLNNFKGANLFWFKGSTHIGFSTMEVTEKYQKFILLPEFSQEELSEGLSQKMKVNNRLSAAIKVFSND